MFRDVIMKKWILGLFAANTVALSAYAAEEVNVYSYRQPFLVEPMLNEFTKIPASRLM